MNLPAIAIENDPVRSLIASWAQKAEESFKQRKWEVCPICLEDVTKLKPCRFKWGDVWKRDELCVKCAETTKSIKRIAEMYPIGGVEVKTGFLGPWKARSTIDNEPIDEVMWRNHYATLSFQNLVIGITPTQSNLVLVKVGEDTPISVDNTLAAWSIASDAVSEFRDPSNF